MKRIMQAMLAIVFALVAVLSLQVGHAYAQDDCHWLTVNAQDYQEVNLNQDTTVEFELVDMGKEGSRVFVLGCGGYQLGGWKAIHEICQPPSSDITILNRGPDDVDIKIFPQQ